MPEPLRLKTVLHPRGPAAAVTLTDEQLATLGGGAKTPPVLVTVNGHTFRGRVGRMGGETLVGFNKAVREACGVQPGDEIDVVIAPDDAPREVAVPEDLAAALQAAGARPAFDALAFSARKEIATGVESAKKPETRARRVTAAVERLSG
jgi:hypothetical protein